MIYYTFNVDLNFDYEEEDLEVVGSVQVRVYRIISGEIKMVDQFESFLEYSECYESSIFEAVKRKYNVENPKRL